MSRRVCVHIRAKCRCACNVVHVRENGWESSFCRPGWLDSTARTIIVENSDVTTVPESIEMPESLLFKFFVWHASHVNRRKYADYVDEQWLICRWLICYMLRNYVSLFVISIDFHSCAVCHWNLLNRCGRWYCDLFFSFFFLSESPPCTRVHGGKRWETPWTRETDRVLTNGAHVFHRGAIVFGLSSFHKFVLSIVRQLTPRFVQKHNENNDRANV